MRCNRILCAGPAGALWISLFFCMGAHASTVPKRNNPQSATTDHTQSATHSTAKPPSGTRDIKLAKALGPSAPQTTSWHRVSVAPGDSLSSIFSDIGLDSEQWMAVLKLHGRVDALKDLHPGDTLELRKTADGRLGALQFRLDKRHMLLINRDRRGLHAKVRRRHTRTRQFMAIGTVRHSLAKALANAHVPATVANQLGEIYRYRDNLSRHMHPGDTFSVIYDAIYSNGRQISAGPIIAASITTDGHNHKAFRAVTKNGDPGYYDMTGKPYKPVFSRHPVAYTRISSPFSLHRMDPVLHIVRPHYGVDMAAPMGTPVHAAGNGTVKFVGYKHGYGRLVELRHIEGYSTRYAHMHRFVKGLHDGERVHEGQVIGYVGETGEATGPHLHFEIRKNSVAHNPLKIKLPAGQPLSKTRLAKFRHRIQPLIAKLDGQTQTLFASASSPRINTPNCRRTISLNAALALNPRGAARRDSLKNMFCVIRHVPADQRVARTGGG